MWPWRIGRELRQTRGWLGTAGLPGTGTCRETPGGDESDRKGCRSQGPKAWQGIRVRTFPNTGYIWRREAVQRFLLTPPPQGNIPGAALTTGPDQGIPTSAVSNQSGTACLPAFCFVSSSHFAQSQMLETQPASQRDLAWRTPAAAGCQGTDHASRRGTQGLGPESPPLERKAREHIGTLGISGCPLNRRQLPAPLKLFSRVELRPVLRRNGFTWKCTIPAQQDVCLPLTFLR